MPKIKISKPVLLILLLIIAAHIFVLSKLIFFPYPEFFIYPYLTNGGLIPYKQIFDQHFPGLMFFPLNFASLGMTTAQSARIWSWGIVAVEQVLIFLVAQRLLKSDKKALLANFIFLVWHPFFEGWVFWIDSILPVFLLGALFFLVSQEERKSSLFLSGLLLGLASVFKQVVIPLALLVAAGIYIRGRKPSSLIYFLSGFLPFPALMVIYFWRLGALKDFWYWTVTYNFTVFAKYGGQSATPSQIIRVLFVYGLSLFVLLESKARKLSFWLFVFLLGGLVSVLARFDFVHLQPSLPFVVVLGALSILFLYYNKTLRILLPAYILGTIYLLGVFYNSHLGSRVLFFDEATYKIVEKVREITYSGEKIFIYAAPAHLYQLSQTMPAGDVFILHFPWFFRVSEGKILEGIKKDKPRVIVADRSGEIQGEKIVENYRLADKIGETEILIRRE